MKFVTRIEFESLKELHFNKRNRIEVISTIELDSDIYRIIALNVYRDNNFYKEAFILEVRHKNMFDHETWLPVEIPYPYGDLLLKLSNF